MSNMNPKVVFRDAYPGESITSYVESMFLLICQSTVNKVIGKHNNLKIELTELDE